MKFTCKLMDIDLTLTIYTILFRESGFPAYASLQTESLTSVWFSVSGGSGKVDAIAYPYMKHLFRQDLQDYQDNFVFVKLNPVHPVDPVRKIELYFVKFLF